MKPLRWALLFLILPSTLWAQGVSPFGVGPAAEPALVSWPWLLQFVASVFSDLLRLVRLASQDPALLMSLCGASFLYGALHAAGPGHGKVVVASALVASGAQLWRSLWLSGLMALTQGLVAIFTVGLLFFFIAASAAEATRFSQLLELASGLGVVVVGLLLFWRSLRPLMSVQVMGSHQTCSHGCAHHIVVDDTTDRLSLWAVFVAGLRPCSGALLLLTLAAGQKAFWVGMVSVLAMSMGTWLSVALLSLFAVWAKDKALAWAGRTPAQHVGWRVVFQVLAALLVIFFGALLVLLSLQWLPVARSFV